MTSSKTRRRLWAGLGLAAVAGALALLITGGLRENVVFFLTPSELQARGTEIHGQAVRLGGQVKPGSVDWNAEETDLRFVLRDEGSEVVVHSRSAPPAMFRPGIGVVVEGTYGADGVFTSDRVMVKHSNEYSPPEEGEAPHETYETLTPRGGGGS